MQTQPIFIIINLDSDSTEKLKQKNYTPRVCSKLEF